MPLILQKLILRADLRANPEVRYLFGDNCDRAGRGGQAAEMRGEPNAIGVRTKRHPNMQSTAFFKDSDEIEVRSFWNEDLAPVRLHHQAGGIVVIPLDGLGTGLARLPYRLQNILEYEIERIFL